MDKIDDTVKAIKKLDDAMMELLTLQPELLNSHTFDSWTCLMMDIMMEPDCTESYQTLGSYQFDEPVQ